MVEAAWLAEDVAAAHEQGGKLLESVEEGLQHLPDELQDRIG